MKTTKYQIIADNYELLKKKFMAGRNKNVIKRGETAEDIFHNRLLSILENDELNNNITIEEIIHLLKYPLKKKKTRNVNITLNNELDSYLVPEADEQINTDRIKLLFLANQTNRFKIIN